MSGVERTPNKSQYTKLTLEKKIFHAVLAGIRTRNLSITSPALYQQAIRSGQNHLVRHCETGKKTKQIEEEVGRQHQGMGRPGVRLVPEGSGEQRKMVKTGCEIIYGALKTLAVKG